MNVTACKRTDQTIMALLKYDKTHIMTKYVGLLVRVLKKHATYAVKTTKYTVGINKQRETICTREV